MYVSFIISEIQTTDIVQFTFRFNVVLLKALRLDMCLVLELLGPDLRSWQLCFGHSGLSQMWVKQILTQVKHKRLHLVSDYISGKSSTN